MMGDRCFSRAGSSNGGDNISFGESLAAAHFIAGTGMTIDGVELISGAVIDAVADIYRLAQEIIVDFENFSPVGQRHLGASVQTAILPFTICIDADIYPFVRASASSPLGPPQILSLEQHPGIEDPLFKPETFQPVAPYQTLAEVCLSWGKS